MSSIDLGFAEECNPDWLTNRYFPSKIGGKPAWLELDALPKPEELICTKCNSAKTFLCQVYSPGDSVGSFHRTLFIFMCRTQLCQVNNSAENFNVFRSQLAVENKFYSQDPPDEDGDPLPPIVTKTKLCLACGCQGPLSCSRCKKASYCSAIHQKAHWPQHKVSCSLENDGNDGREKSVPLPEVVFPEYEIMIQALEEPKQATSDSDNDAEKEKERLKEYEKLVAEGKTGGVLKDVADADIEQFLQTDDDEQFSKFKETIASASNQVIRYNRGGHPIWITDVAKTLGDITIPNCETCGAERHFEFQIMPQMLNLLEDDRIDWGVLAVYTCSQSCDPSPNGKAYIHEFIIKQDIVGAHK